MGKWMTPKDLAVSLIDSMVAEKSASGLDIKTSTQDPKTKSVSELKRKAEMDLQKIKTKYAGIDADQGHGLATWWMKHQEVNLLIKELSENPPQGDTETIIYESGPIEKIEFSFFQNYFYKVVYHFRIAENRAMEILYQKIVETYGKTDQDKEQERIAAEAAAAAEENPPAEAPKEGEQAAEPEIPQEITLTWTGKETVGTLHVKLVPDKSAYSTFTLTKENKKIIPEVTLLMEKERKAKSEEEKKKLLEQYKDFQIK